MTIPLDTGGIPHGQADPMIGMPVYAGYLVEKLLGAGGMGAVYLAVDRLGGDDGAALRVAVKILLPAYSQHGEIVARLYGEARAASKIGHENIVKIQARGTLPDGRAFVAMEYLEGSDLEKHLESWGMLSLRDALALLVQIASALHAAHCAGIVHRDIKPANIFISQRRGFEAGWVKVLDFGIAKFRQGLAEGMKTRAGAVIGTPQYMSPEQSMGGYVDHRTDIWALALVLHQMVCGRLPEHGPSGVDWMDPRYFRPDLPEAFAQTILWGLAFHPDARPPSMLVWIRALVDAARGEGGRAICDQYAPGFYDSIDPDAPTTKHAEPSAPHPGSSSASAPGTVTGAAGVIATKPTVNERAPRGERKPSRRFLPIASAAAVAAVAIAVAAVAFTAGRGGDPPASRPTSGTTPERLAPDAGVAEQAVVVDAGGPNAALDAGRAVDAAPKADVTPAIDAAPPDASRKRKRRPPKPRSTDQTTLPSTPDDIVD